MRRAWFAVLAAVVLVGCGSKAVIPVNGIVTMDGVPLDGAAVTFFPDGKAATLGGMARTGSDGKFVITGAKGEAGLVPGSYKVTVSKLKGGGAVTDEAVIAAPSETEIARKNDLPPHYSDPTKTKLSYSVTGDGKPIEIKLTMKKK